jgi:hypothetical protein
MTAALASEMKDEVKELLSRVAAEERNPGVRPIGVTHLGRSSSTLSLGRGKREAG